MDARFLSPRKLMPAIVRHTQRRDLRRRRRRARQISAADDKAFVFLDDDERSEAGTPPHGATGSSATDGERANAPGDDIAIRYLDHCVNVNWNRDPAVHNYLLSLYAKGDDDTALLRFLRSQCGGAGGSSGAGLGSSGGAGGGGGCGGDDDKDAAAVLDLKYALRVCSRAGMDRACVQIYSAMGLYDEAVTRALAKGDVALAKLNADHPDDEATRKRLWKRIARHVIRGLASQDRVDEAAIAVMDESSVLTIEDVLPYCPAFSSVGAFKEQICDALHAYTEQVQELEDEMEDYVESANGIRDDINRVLERTLPAAHGAPCGLCGRPVATGDHYVPVVQTLQSSFPAQLRGPVAHTCVLLCVVRDRFPCTHRFHCACLVRDVRERSRTADPDMHARILELQAQIKKLSRQMAERARRVTTGNSLAKELHQRRRRAAVMQQELLIDELDEMVASKCPFCSSAMIQAVGAAFISQEEEEREGKLWRL